MRAENPAPPMTVIARVARGASSLRRDLRSTRLMKHELAGRKSRKYHDRREFS